MKTLLAAAVIAMLAACAGTDSAPNWPEASTLYSAGSEVTCDASATMTVVSDVQRWCTFDNVLVDGAPHCYAVVVFTRQDVGAPWIVEHVFVSGATCD